MKKEIIKIVFILVATLSFAACSNEDDIDEIFTGHSWTLAFFNDQMEKPIDGDYIIIFNGSIFTLTTPSNTTITGNWKADGETRAFHCSNVKTTGNINNDDTAKRMRQILQNATSYAGDANYLQIIARQGNVNAFMQFHNK